jgi:hypothetical protein
MTQNINSMPVVFEETTLLQYTVLPADVYYTRDSGNPSYAVITIGASNTTENNIIIAGIQVKLPVSNHVKDENALTRDPSSITPVSMQPLDWDFSRFDDGIFRAAPILADTPVAPGESITFQLQNVLVNEAPGTAVIIITENDGNGNFTESHRQVVKIASKLDISSFYAVPDHITSGASCTLTWTNVATARVSLTPGDWPDIIPNASVPVNPLRTTVYTLTAYGEGPNVSKQVTVFINSPEIVSFTASAYKVNAGDKISLSWEVKYADAVSISPGKHVDLPLKGTLDDIEILTATTFIITANNKGNEHDNLTVEVGINPVVINSFTATPGYGARLGEPVTFSWDVLSAVSAEVQYGTVNSVDKDHLNKGNLDIIPNSGAAYSLIAANSLGTAMKSLVLFPMPLGWKQFTSSAPFNFPEPPLVLNFKTEMWVMASNYMNKVYRSFDGSNWIPVGGAVPWQTRSYCTGIVFNNKMWLMGGLGTNGSCLNDVWSSSDGITWTQETPQAQWPARQCFGCFKLPNVNKIFIVGGINQAGIALTDVWSSPDGKTWTQETAQAFQNGRYAFGTVTYNNAAWILAGFISGGATVNEVWKSTDGITWTIQPKPNWAPRSFPVTGALSNGIYLGGGLTPSYEGIHDMNRMNAAGKWSSQGGFAWKDILNTAGVEYQDALWYIGGSQPGGVNANKSVWAYTPDLNIPE